MMEPFTFSQYSFTPNDNDLLDLNANPSEKNSPHLIISPPGLSGQRSVPYQVVKKEPLIKGDSPSPSSPMSMGMSTQSSSTTPPHPFPSILMPQAIPAPQPQRLPWAIDPYSLNQFS